jgi:putative ABC transport system permease protein
MLTPRWKKVLADLWSNKMRTLLVALSISVGVFAVGMIAESRIRMLRGLSEDYLQSDPFSGALATVDPFEEELLETIRRIDGVAEADARQSIRVRIRVSPAEWKDLSLDAIGDFDDIRVSRMEWEAGAWPPPDKEMLIERSALNPMLGVQLAMGHTFEVETLDQKRRRMRIAGVVHDLNLPPALFTGSYYGYITEETLEWLGATRGEYNSVSFRVDKEHLFDREYINQVALKVRDKIEKSGNEVSEIFIPPDPGKSPVASFGLDPIVLILSAVGVLAVLLSGFLVTNTISGMLAQQMRQIGIMKAIGARNGQIFVLYLVLVVCYGLIALAIGAPLAYFAAGAFANFFGGLFNFDPRSYGIIPEVLAMELFVSIVIPILASLYPLFKGALTTIREALTSEGGPGAYGASIIDRIINRVRAFPRPVLLSLRNTFRRKGRLALTLITLIIAGGTFIAVFSVQDSVKRSLDEIFGSLYRADVQVDFERYYRNERILQETMAVEGVEYAETWGSIGARRLRPDNSESEVIFLEAPPADTILLKPDLLEGRWLKPEDENALVVSSGVTKEETDLAVNDEIVLKIKGDETTWLIVGVYKGFGTEMTAYSNRHYFERETHDVGIAQTVRIITRQHDKSFQLDVKSRLEKHYREAGLRVSSSITLMEIYDMNVDIFNIIVYCLLIMAILTAVVGGLGLAGTMSMNVLERTREIGVMRAIGASDLSIQTIVLTEGIIIGLLSWLLGALLAYPLSRMLSNAVGTVFTGSPFSYVYSVNGMIMWLVVVLVLSIVASFLPAWNSSRLTVRDVLAYE